MAKIVFARYPTPTEPTPEQAEIGDYPKRKMAWKGLTFAIENEAGTMRRGQSRTGVAWERRMHYAYGEILNTDGVDGDPVDVFVGPLPEDATHVYVVHQNRYGAWDEYDEDKCLIGFGSEEEAVAAFMSCYDDPRFLGPVTALPVDEFIRKARATKGAPAMIKAIVFLKGFVGSYVRNGRTIRGYHTSRFATVHHHKEQRDLFAEPEPDHRPAATAEPEPEAKPEPEPEEQPEAKPKPAERFTYGLILRPADKSTLPPGYIPGSAKLDSRFGHGTAEFDRRLTPEETRHFDLVDLKAQEERAEQVEAMRAKIEANPAVAAMVKEAGAKPEDIDDDLFAELVERAKAEAEPKEEGGTEGDTKVVDGVTYTLSGDPLRWHRTTEDAEAADAEDREDLAEALAEDPHSERAKEAITRVVEKRAAGAGEPDDDLDPSSPNYRYRDTGYVAGSRKELAAEQIKRMAKAGEHVRATDIDWSEIEQNPRAAKDLIVKDNLFGKIDWESLREAGMEPGAAFLLSKVYSAVGTKPAEDTLEGRKNYATAIDSLLDRAGKVKTADEAFALLNEIREERDGVLMNAAESAIHAMLRDQANTAFRATRALEDQRTAIGSRGTGIGQRIMKLERDHLSRRARGQKAQESPELVDLRAELVKVQAEVKAFEEANGMISERRQGADHNPAAGVYSIDVHYPYKVAHKQARDALSEFRFGVVARNQIENTMGKAWRSLGEGFNRVLDYRSHKGSDAFAKHVATVKAGKVTNWDWAEKGTAPRAATKRGTSFQLEIADEYRRTGGREVTVASTADLKDRFNLREVQSGNWVLDDVNAAKFNTESAAEAFADLADVLGLDDRQVSFNGRLALAFGARGKGKAAAHYERVERVINLTKMSGAGSLAHEWLHFIDNVSPEATSAVGVAGTADSYGTENPSDVDDPEVREAFRAVTNAMMSGSHRPRETFAWTERDEKWADAVMDRSLGFAMQIKNAPSMQAAADLVADAYEKGRLGTVGKKRAKDNFETYRKLALIHHGRNPERQVTYETGKGVSLFLLDSLHLDQDKSGKYWSTPREMAARAFSTYVQRKLQAMGRENTYLVAKSENRDYAHLNARPFPDREEYDRIEASFDRLFAALRSRDVFAKALAAMGPLSG